MGINSEFKQRFKWFDFNEKWELLEPNQENTIKFLSSLDLYVYNSHYEFIETQCRATIEAMLTGLPIVAPSKNNFLNQIWHNKSGFLWNTYEECKDYVKFLEKNISERIKMGKLAREISREMWCDSRQHLKLWENIFENI
jgi:glycosyltransferase involved in cell wall biosynthesis